MSSAKSATPRMRVLAGPNGSGKSTVLHDSLEPHWIGVFVNADEIQAELKGTGHLRLGRFKLGSDAAEVGHRLAVHVAGSGLSTGERQDLHQRISVTDRDGELVLAVDGAVDSYVAAVIADALRRELLELGETFTFETVMSGPDKIDFMLLAQRRGYRVYLYFVSTDDVVINIDRVGRRVTQGGHCVPVDKIRKRYNGSLANLTAACQAADRAFIFDNSGETHELLCATELNGDEFSLSPETDLLPLWFTSTEIGQAAVAQLARNAHPPQAE